MRSDCFHRFLNQNVSESCRFIKEYTNLRPKIAIILGSGLGEFCFHLKEHTIINSTAIPHYPKSTVVGHRGNLIFGKLHRIPVLVFQGRVHYYETGDIETVLYPIRVAHALKIKTLIITNAAGGINTNFKPGDLMLIKDHINLTFENPLRPSDHLRGSFNSNLPKILYDDCLQKVIKKVALRENINLKEGVYCGLKGPSYETSAEIQMLRFIGADAVGMSTVNEVFLAVELGIRVAGISCITNMSTGISRQKLSHREVTEVADKVKQTFCKLVECTIKNIG